MEERSAGKGNALREKSSVVFLNNRAGLSTKNPQCYN